MSESGRVAEMIRSAAWANPRALRTKDGAGALAERICTELAEQSKRNGDLGANKAWERYRQTNDMYRRLVEVCIEASRELFGKNPPLHLWERDDWRRKLVAAANGDEP